MGKTKISACNKAQARGGRTKAPCACGGEEEAEWGRNSHTPFSGVRLSMWLTRELVRDTCSSNSVFLPRSSTAQGPGTAESLSGAVTWGHQEEMQCVVLSYDPVPSPHSPCAKGWNRKCSPIQWWVILKRKNRRHYTKISPTWKMKKCSEQKEGENACQIRSTTEQVKGLAMSL